MEEEFKELRKKMSYLSDVQWNASIQKALDNLIKEGRITRIWDPDTFNFIYYPVLKS
jgi:hypothetical protein